jgi:dephospho-CoA kinase
MPGSGKEEFINVAEEFGFEVVRMGDLVREEALRRGLDLNDVSVGGLANEERERYGMGIWAERTIPKITGPRVIIDGVRGIAEVKVFRDAFSSDLSVVSIEASGDTRYERIRSRGRKDATLTRAQFEGRDERERSWGIEMAMKDAEYTIRNEGALEDYQAEARSLLGELVRM